MGLTKTARVSEQCVMAVIRESELPALKPFQLDVLRRYAMFQATADEMRTVLGAGFDADLAQMGRASRIRFRLPEPGIVLTRDHISNALDLKRFDLVTERHLVDWANFLLSNDAYVLDPGDEDLIADWLNDISANLDTARI
jgi:hypothetical protein